MGEGFQYALLRAVPSLARGEAVNVGVVLHCRRASFLGLRAAVDPGRLRCLSPSIDTEAVAGYVTQLEQVADGTGEGHPISSLNRSERFGWIVSPSSTIVQPSEVHTGLTGDPSATLDRLFDDLVRVPEA